MCVLGISPTDSPSVYRALTGGQARAKCRECMDGPPTGFLPRAAFSAPHNVNEQRNQQLLCGQGRLHAPADSWGLWRGHGAPGSPRRLCPPSALQPLLGAAHQRRRAWSLRSSRSPLPSFQGAQCPSWDRNWEACPAAAQNALCEFHARTAQPPARLICTSVRALAFGSLGTWVPLCKHSWCPTPPGMFCVKDRGELR